jgi:DNA-binding NarL/FixJ family response regulator
MAQRDDGKGHAANAETGLTSLNCALIVEDEFIIAEGLRVQLEDMGIRVCGVAASADDAVDLAVAHGPGLVLMDMRLKGEADGVDAALAIHARIGSKVIFITGSREQATIDRIALDHAAATLFKPVSPFQLRRTIERVVVT